MTSRMGDERRFSARWDFRRKENYFDDSSSDDPDSSTQDDPDYEDPDLVLDSNQLDTGTTTVTREQAVKTRKRRSKKDESKPEKAKQVRRRKPKVVRAVLEDKKKEEMETSEVGMFMNTLLDDLKASRDSLMNWMSTELCGSSEQNVASRPHQKKRAASVGVAAQRPVKKRRTKKQMEEEKKKKESEKQSKQNEISQEKSSEIVQNSGEQAQELDDNAGPLDMLLQSGEGSVGRNYVMQQEQGQEGTVTNQKSVVLAIKAPELSQIQKKSSEADTTDTIIALLSMGEGTGSETQKYDDNFAVPFAPSSSLQQSFPLGSSSLNSLFPSSSSSQGVTSFASNNNFQPPVAPQIPDLSEFQTRFTGGGQGFGNPIFQDNSYFSGFPASFQPNLMAGGYNFPAQVNLEASSQQRDHNNMAGGVIRYPEPDFGNGNNSFSNYILALQVDKHRLQRQEQQPSPGRDGTQSLPLWFEGKKGKKIKHQEKNGN